jgi:hypothetical protein
MSKYGFDDDPAADPIPEAIALPKPKQKSPRPPAEAVKEAVKAGAKLGFVSREPDAADRPARKGGRRKAPEPQDNIYIAGPQRVIDAFRAYCDEQGVASYWLGLEALLKSERNT